MVRVAFLLAVAISVVAAVSASTLIEHINSVQDSWTAGFNYLSGKSREYKKALCGVAPEQKSRLPVKEDIEILENIPATFDARKHWPNCPSIKSIKNQGRCGNDWAVTPATVVTDRFCIATNGTANFELSVEDLTFCCYACFETSACSLGYPSEAWHYLQTVGVVTGGDYGSDEGCQPYQVHPTKKPPRGLFSKSKNDPICERSCSNKKYGTPYDQDKHFSKNGYQLHYEDVKAMQTEILKYGPIAATFKVYEDFYNYKKGIYSYVSGEYLGDHSVKIIGWGKEKDDEYWLVANSWGTSWGEDGFFKIERGSNECDIELSPYAAYADH